MAFWVIIGIIGSIAGSVYLAKKEMQKAMEGQGGMFINKTSSSEGLRIIYGERRVGAVKVWKGVTANGLKLTSNNNQNFLVNQTSKDNAHGGTRSSKDWLHRLDVWGQGEIQEIRYYHIDGDRHTHSRFNSGSHPIFRSLGYYGSDTQVAPPNLVSGHSEVTSAMKGRGVAYSWNRFFLYHKDVQYQGEPNITATIKGLKVWNPNTHPNSPSTKSWSDNPALILLDYLMADYGKGLAQSDIDIDSFKTAATACDTTVTIPGVATNDSGSTIPYYNWITGNVVDINDGDRIPYYREDQGDNSTTQKRFSCNIVLDPKNDTSANVQEILKTCRGTLPFSQGKYKLVLEDTGSYVASFDSNNMLGGLNISHADRSKRLNRVTVTFPNKNKDFEQDQVTFPKINSSLFTTFKNADNGEELHTEVELNGVTDFYQAEDIAEFIVRDSRTQLQVSFTAQPSALNLEPGDIIRLTHGTPNWTNKLFKVRQLQINSDLTVNIKAQEYDANVYPWSTTTNEPPNDKEQIDIFAVPDAVTSLSTTALALENVDGTKVSGINASWALPTTNESAIDRIFVGYKVNGESNYTWATLPAEETNWTIKGLKDNTAYVVSVYYKNIVGRFAPETTSNITLPTLTTPVGDSVTSFYRASAPSSSESNDGDLWIQTTTNKIHRYNTNQWVTLQDSQIGTALTNAAGAQSTADGKIITFIQGTEPTSAQSSVGDLWFDTSDGNAIHRYSGSVWNDAKDSDIATALANASNAQTTADSKIETFYASSAPQSGMSDGDLWIHTTNKKLYRYNTNQWLPIQDSDIATAISNAASAQTTADGKIVTFIQGTEPTAAQSSTGDIWFDTSDGNAVHVYSSSSVWVDAKDTDIAQAIANAATAQTTANNTPRVIRNNTAPTTRDNNTALQGHDIWIDTNDNNQSYVRNTANTAWEKSRDATLVTSVGSLESYAAASYVLQVNSNGNVAGMIIQNSTNSGGQTTSNVIFQADKFRIENGSGSEVPFSISSGSVFIDNAFITNLSGTKIDSSTKVTAGTGNNVAVLDGADSTYRIYAGHATPGSAKFRVTQGGTLTAVNAVLSGTLNSGQAFTSGSGTRTVSISASTTGNYILTAGNAVPSVAPFRIKADGTVQITSLELFKSDGVTKMFDSTTGFTDDAFSAIAADLGTSTNNYTTSILTNTTAQKITLTANQNLTIKGVKSARMTGYSNVNTGLALGQIPSKVRMRIMHSTYADLSNANQLAVLGSSWTAGVDRVSSGTPSSSQYRATSFSEGEPGFNFYEWEVFDVSGDAITGSGNSFEITNTASYTGSTGGTDHYFWVEIAGTGGNGNGSNSVSTSAVRSLNISGSSFFIDSSGNAADTNTGDITSVSATGGLSGGGNSGGVSLSIATNIPGNKTFDNDVTITGDLTVNGTNVILNTTSLDVEDKNITIAKLATTSALASGSGLTFGAWSSGTTPKLSWENSVLKFWFNKNVYIDGSLTSSSNIVTTNSSAVIQTPRISMEADGTLDWGSAKNYGTLTWDTNKAIVVAQSGSSLEFKTNNTGLALTLDTSQNATFAGTINSGAITASGTSQFTSMYVDDQIISTGDTNTYFQFNAADTARIVVGGSQKFVVNSSGVSISNGTLNMNSGNLTSVGTISSGTISSGDISITGQSTGVEGGQINLLGVGSIEDIHVDNYNGTFRIFDGSAPQVRLSLNTSGNATFAGTINSGNISSSGTVTANSSMQIIGATGSSGFMYIYDRDNGTSTTDGFLLQKSGNHAYVYNRESAGKLFLGAGNTNSYLTIFSNGDYYTCTHYVHISHV